MADKLIFPIGFDLEKGIQEAQGDADRLLRRLETQIKSRPLAVNLKINGAGDGSINSINSRIKELVERWNSLTEAERVASKTSGEYTAEAKKILAEYTRLVGASESYARTLQQISSAARRSANEQEKMATKQRASWEKLRKAISANENTINGLNAKIKAYQQRLNGVEVGSKKFEKTAEKIRQLSIRLDEAKKKVAEFTGKMASNAPKQAQAVKLVNQELQNQDGYVSRLLKRMAVYAGYSMVGTFLTNVREVTAQFELQRISLGAIIQDQSRANQLFSEIKAFALKSPIKILDLSKYTKQLAAYKIGSDELFDTTKRLTDISVGLGVAMERIVLFYGQVRAKGWLTAQDLKQATEAGIPLTEELAKKLSAVNGELVTAGQVMDMISKRQISFEQVKEVFDDMTSAGGMFYNMQEKQGNTLYGMWAKLGDAASVMYEQIGNTSSVNSGMKDLIQMITDLMKNWRLVGREMVVVVSTLALLRTNTVLSTKNMQSAAVATNQYAVAQTRLNAAQKAGHKISASAAKYSAKAAVANRAAAMSTNAWTAAQFKLIAATNSLKAAFLGNWITLTIAAIAAIGAAIYSAYEKAHKLQNELKEIETAGMAESAKSVFNFERLANAALSAANGSKQQKDALEELKRTYKDTIPAEELSITNLRKMREEGYAPLTAAIKEYIAQRTLQKEIDAITENYTSDIIAKQREVRELLKRGSTYNFFKGVAWSPIEGLDDDQISQVFANVDKIAKDKSKSWQDVWIDAIKGVANVSEEQEAKMRRLFNNSEQNANQSSYNNKLRDIVDNTRDMATETDAATKKMDEQTGSLGKYGKVLAETNKSLENLRLTSNGNVVDPNTFLAKQMNNNAHIKAWKDDIVEDLKDAGIDINNEWFNIIQNLNATSPSQISSIDFAPILDAIEAAKDKLGDKYIPLKNAIGKYQELYNGVVPSDRTVAAMRSRLMQIANNVDKTGNIMNDLQRHLMQSGDTWEGYSKSVRDAVEEYESQIQMMERINDLHERGLQLNQKGYSEEEIKKIKLIVEALKQLFPHLSPEKSSGSGRPSDQRLQTLQEMVQLAEKLNKEYQDWQKKVGSTEALDRVRNTYEETVRYAEKLAKDNGITLPHLEVPTNAKELNEYLEVIQRLMDNKTIKGGKKAAIELGVKMSANISTEEQQAIEKKLKELTDRISRTKTAKEFYDKILSQTGDINLAGKVSMSIYGDNGDLKALLAKQVRELTNGIKLPNGIIKADNLIDYKALREFAEANRDELGKTYDELVKIAEQGQKDLAKTYEGYLKDLEKAKSYSDKRIELARYTANKIAEIGASTLPNAEKKRLSAGYQERETQKQGELEWEAFKDMPMYVQMFDDLDNASVRTLSNMKQRLSELQSVWGSTLNPTQLKELQSRMSEIDAQLAKKNPFKTLSDSIKEYKDLRLAHGSEDKLNSEIDTATKAYDEARAALAKQLEENPHDTEAVENLQKRVDLSEEELKQLQKIADAYKKVKDAIGLSLGEVFKIAGSLGDLASGIGKVTGVFGGSEEDVQYWNDIADGLNEVTSGIENMVQAALSGNPIGIATAAITAIPNMISGFANLFSAGKVKKANKEIKRQQQIIENLEYTYGRLEKAAEKALGIDYISNYNQQLKVLQAQALAYQRQAQAERSKGKKADEDKIKEYENSYRETMDAIADMQGKLSEQFLGTDATSAARDFVSEWFDARVAFGNTADAIAGKYKEMVKSMIVEGTAAKLVQSILDPLYKEVDRMLGKGDIEGATDYLVGNMDNFISQADSGLETLYQKLLARGYDMKSLLGESGSELTGISRDIASASEESINGLAAGINTQNYYIAQQLAEVRAIRELLNAGLNPSLQAGATAMIDRETWQREAFDRFAMIERYTGETVAECRNIAQQCAASAETCKSMAADLHRVITPRNTKAAFGVQVFMD